MEKSAERIVGAGRDRRLAIAQLLTAANNQYRVTWDALALELAVNALEGLNFEDLQRAVMLWLIESHWPPTIADLRANYTRVQQQRRYAEARAEDAAKAKEWDKISEQHLRADKTWADLPEEEKEKLLVLADHHPLCRGGYMGREVVAKNILLFAPTLSDKNPKEAVSLSDGDGRRTLETTKDSPH